MTRLGDLERAAMDVLWDRSSAAPEGLTVREVAEGLRERELAYTTVMTVLDRLAGKGMVQREREGRAWRYRAAASREAHIAQLMLEALDLGGSRDAALVRFARSVTGTEAEVLRAALTSEVGSASEGASANAGTSVSERAPASEGASASRGGSVGAGALVAEGAHGDGAGRAGEAADRQG